MGDYRGYNAAELRIEKLVEIAMAVNHPGLLGVTTEEARLITKARMGMAGILLRLAVYHVSGRTPGGKS